ncbi:MAG: class I SAM-dependent methyltransferase [Planctomycetota bacterium]
MAAKRSRSSPKPGGKTDWQPVADWYDDHVGDDGGEFHREVVLPGTMRLLGGDAVRGKRVLDVACGQGVLCRRLHEAGATAVGVDASPALIERARDRGDGEFHVGDARDLSRFSGGGFDAATCLLAVANIHPIRPVFEGMAAAIRDGGSVVMVTNHPAFRGAKETHWGWDDQVKVQYRRVDRYLSPRKSPITTHPGDVDRGYTWTFHRPVGHYVKALRHAGLLVDAMEEWPSHKTSGPGPRQKAENLARKEIPMFLAIRALKIAMPSPPSS